MIKNKACIELEIAGKMYTFLCDSDSSLPDVLKAVTEMKQLVIGRVTEAQEAQEKAKPSSQDAA